MIKKFKEFINENINSRLKMKSIVDDLLNKEKGGREYFDKIDNSVKLPKNIDMFQYVFNHIHKINNNFNLILTGGFGDWILTLIKKGKLNVPNNIVLLNGNIRGKDNKLNKLTYGDQIVISYKKYDIENQEFILFDDSYYSGSTKNAIDNFLKKYNSRITQTYVLYDGNDEIDKNRLSLYRYYTYNIGTKLSPEKLIRYLNNFNLDLPIYSIEKNILKGNIVTLRQLIVEINKLLRKFNKNEIDIKNYNRKSELELKEKIKL